MSASDPAPWKVMHSPICYWGRKHRSGRITGPVDREKVSMTLPELSEDVVERILAMVPYPFIFKARVLSKSWLARLSPISSQEDEEMKSLAIAFQKMVSEYSRKWKTFCGPVFAGDENFFAHGQGSQVYRRLPTPTLPFTPRDLLANGIASLMYPSHLQGALLFVDNRQSWDFRLGDMFVANVLTRSWKRLPVRPSTDGGYNKYPCGPATLVSNQETYKVMEFYANCPGFTSVLIYDSTLKSWSRKLVEVPNRFTTTSHHLYLNGIVYWLVDTWNRATGWNLLTFNVEEETFDLLKMPPIDLPTAEYASNLLICNGKMFMVLLTLSARRYAIILKIDPISQTIVKVTESVASSQDFKVVSLGDYIFFLGRECIKVLAYNTEQNEWISSSIPRGIPMRLYRSYCTAGLGWVSSSFQPGLNPFVAP